jgi:predicted acylesterase/phospholipase RssA
VRRARRVPRKVPPGDDVCPTPAPVDEEPPADRFCDLVLTGGVASGVVYPWAIVELARCYRFRNIGGTSVGAMAAALAAAAEYGRRTGVKQAFEPLRLTPANLGEVLPDGRTRMMSLFQPNPRGKRLVGLWGRLFRGEPEPGAAGDETSEEERRRPGLWTRVLIEVLRAFALPCSVGAAAAVAFVLAVLLCLPHTDVGPVRFAAAAIALILVLAPVGAIAGFVLALLADLRQGVVANGLGLCKGGTFEPPGPEGERPGLSEWLHEGIQISAGREFDDPPLTFRDLWEAPAFPGALPRRCGEADPITSRAINLQVITTNVTHGRPYRLPLVDETSRLFFRRKDLEGYFPPGVLDALVAASRPYAPLDPGSRMEPPAGPETEGLLQLPGADLPLVVAARLSLSFPLLFSAVPLWAIDYEPREGGRNLKRCQFTDGGVSSNFPVHLFDSALPRWPTFGMWLDRRNPYRKDSAVWLPRYHGQGWGDSWNRFDPEAAHPDAPEARDKGKARLGFLAGFFLGIATSAADWQDRTSFRLPHVRNRVARLRLLPTEGGLHIGMPRRQILQMARRYGTETGRLFVATFADKDGKPSRAWSEQRWVRLQLLIDGLRERLGGVSTSADWSAYTVPVKQAIDDALEGDPIREKRKSSRLNEAQTRSLHALLGELQQLEDVLGRAEEQPFDPIPKPELRLRAPL